MIRNYLKMAWRNLLKDKTFSFLNIFGLAVAFGVAILLSIYALFELSYDQFHSDEVYIVYSTDQTPKGAQASTSREIPFAGALQEEVPGIEKITRYMGTSGLIISGDKQIRLNTTYVDPDFFSIFNFPLIKGDKENPITEKSTVAITQYAAKTIFNSEDVIGETIRILQEGEETPYTVAAIVEDFPDQSSMGFDVVLNFKNLPDFVYADNLNAWDKSNHEVFLKLSENVTPAEFEKSTRAFTELHYQEELEAAKRDGAQPDANGHYKQFRLVPFSDSRFLKFENGIAKISKTMPYLVLGIAFLILFIASVNFINMSIARSSQRLREIGMRKTLGAGKIQLFLQFWGDSILIFLAAMALGALLATYLIDPFKTLFETSASFKSVSSPHIIAIFLLVLLLITLSAGGYPAILQSRLGTLQALKGKLETTGKNRVRNFLMVLQFGIAILLISGTLILWNQLEFMRNKDLGFDKEQVIAFPLNGKQSDQRAMQLLRNELQDKPGIISVSASNNILGMGKDQTRSTSVIGFEFQGRGVRTNMIMVDHDYIETLGLEMIKGRSFDRQFATDSLAVVINEAMVRELNEEDILSTRITLDDSIQYSVIGVLKDYNFQDLNREIEPMTLFLNPGWNLRHAYVKVAPQNVSGSFEKVKAAWNKIEPQAEFMGSFLDENIDRTLKRERNMTTMITSGSIIAIILSCTGLFAISLLVVTQRRKEIGIRKVVGASVSNITFMLTMDFLKLVGLAFLIAAPIAWHFGRKWIQNYPYRIDLNLWIFLAVSGIAVLIALLTVSFQAIKAATSNPVNSLKSE
ncbi:ABC transporter permease [Antarcticibacterium sp. 1MA-6-2]|uniref:ABC transporter permease n=1 Tax=Antarcticibacterium sp. 1MA-6-2 TaxID=2908210 RepID=UPI001F3CA62E|nr:FtsX-like permease family protein [Antarcticibacterium sp. 1MA-6-2]UJH90989.1 ABC transporter permease [Antarcticibacterium sp. 1MA-6-2]